MEDSSHSRRQLAEPVSPRQRIGVDQALMALVVAFLGAQLAGKVVAGAIGASASLHAAKSLAVHGMLPEVVVPSMLISELMLLLVALAMPLMAALPLRETLGLTRAPWPVFLAAAFGTVMLGPIGDVFMTALAGHFPKLGMGVVPALHDIARVFPWPLLWPTFALMPGLAEELLFRGVLQRAIVRPALAIAISGSAFAIFHVDPVHVIGVLPLGLFLSWVAQRSGTSVTIFAHVVNNSVAIVSMKSATLDVGYGTGRPLPEEWVVASLAGVLLASVVIALSTAPRTAPNQ